MPQSEAIIDQAKAKGAVQEYQDLMRGEFPRVLQGAETGGRWMTVGFHNSHNSVWNAIQEAMSSVGLRRRRRVRSSWISSSHRTARRRD